MRVGSAIVRPQGQYGRPFTGPQHGVGFGLRGLRGLGASAPAVFPDPIAPPYGSGSGPSASYGSLPDLEYYLKHSLSHDYEGSFAGYQEPMDGTLDLSTVDFDGVVGSFIEGGVNLCQQQQYNKVMFGYPVDPNCPQGISQSNPGPLISQYANMLRQWMGDWAAYQKTLGPDSSPASPGVANYPLTPCQSMDPAKSMWTPYCKGGAPVPVVSAVPVSSYGYTPSANPILPSSSATTPVSSPATPNVLQSTAPQTSVFGQPAQQNVLAYSAPSGIPPVSAQNVVQNQAPSAALTGNTGSFLSSSVSLPGGSSLPMPLLLAGAGILVLFLMMGKK